MTELEEMGVLKPDGLLKAHTMIYCSFVFLDNFQKDQRIIPFGFDPLLIEISWNMNK